ncbi:hypothetical protein ACU4GD_38065 [Cupriavidus basilensis]
MSKLLLLGQDRLASLHNEMGALHEIQLIDVAIFVGINPKHLSSATG